MNTIGMRAAPLFFKSLGANAVFSGGSGLLMSLTPGTVVGWLGVDAVVTVRIIGLMLLGFALFLSIIVMQRQIKALNARLIVAGDLAWVYVSLALVAMGGGRFTAEGRALILAVAAVVLTFALAQIRGLYMQTRPEAP